MEALNVYRSEFKPSRYLDQPYVMTGVPLVAAETDTEAQRLATSALQRHLKLIRGEPIFVPPPIETMEGVWSEAERFLVESRLEVAIIGGPATVKQKLDRFLRDTAADELMFTSDLYDHSLRRLSFEIAADAIKQLGAATGPRVLAPTASPTAPDITA
jgi:alkanesulfonate monooxygenase SsuD/methylene tetrahydromethanopterin reductase-like flavin-dependent oxidoreductase (luciferase family)